MLKTKKCLFLITIAFVAFGFTSVQAFAEEDFSKPDELVLKSEAVFKSFMADPQMKWFHEHVSQAKGIFIVPRMIRAGFFIGAPLM